MKGDRERSRNLLSFASAPYTTIGGTATLRLHSTYSSVDVFQLLVNAAVIWSTQEASSVSSSTVTVPPPHPSRKNAGTAAPHPTRITRPGHPSGQPHRNSTSRCFPSPPPHPTRAACRDSIRSPLLPRHAPRDRHPRKLPTAYRLKIPLPNSHRTTHTDGQIGQTHPASTKQPAILQQPRRPARCHSRLKSLTPSGQFRRRRQSRGLLGHIESQRVVLLGVF